ncbi:hypothetical protein [Gluconacetobacter asukensis]|uniref:Uncharacterized protein n=1 Tax=Gluconacetobacter asukensis TaxID=1017181 RepID=A0A7W4J3J0_9PROT|nr:hypothetical protein [Gluconacetobacter asukensis]MBB2174065.1 hypothetical protein [Gluconacetobacter asukensis]
MERRLNQDAASLIADLNKEFVTTFGRKPRSGDRLFQLSDRYVRRATLRAMREAKIPLPLIYAYVKTGLIVTDRKKLTGRDQELWDAAVKEYYDICDIEGECEPDPEGALEDILSAQLRRNHTIGGSFIERHYNNYKARPGSSRDVETVAGFMVSNFVRGLLSISVLVQGEAAYDAYNICRSMLENYLALAYMYRSSGPRPFMAQLGILLGTHRYNVTKKGQENQSRIVEIATGSTTAMPSRWEMSRALGSLHEMLYTTLYRDLSSICHPDITGIQTILSDTGYDFLNPVSSIDVLSTTHFLSLLLFSLLAEVSPCTKVARSDLRAAACRSFFELSHLRKIVTPAHELTFPPVFSTFLDDFSSRDAHFKLIAESVTERSCTTTSAISRSDRHSGHPDHG